MASEVIDVTGIAKWAKVTEASRDMGSKIADGAKYDYPEACTIDVVLDQGDLKTVKAAYPKINVRIDDDGMMVKFRRNWVNGRNPKWGGAPVVVDADDNPWPDDKLIGNGSKVRVAAEVYDTKHGKGMRLLKVMVLDWVEPDLPDEPDLPF